MFVNLYLTSFLRRIFGSINCFGKFALAAPLATILLMSSSDREHKRFVLDLLGPLLQLNRTATRRIAGVEQFHQN